MKREYMLKQIFSLQPEIPFSPFHGTCQLLPFLFPSFFFFWSSFITKDVHVYIENANRVLPEAQCLWHLKWALLSKEMLLLFVSHLFSFLSRSQGCMYVDKCVHCTNAWAWELELGLRASLRCLPTQCSEGLYPPKGSPFSNSHKGTMS